MITASVIEIAGSAQTVLTRAAELRGDGWNVEVRGSRLTPACELVWSLRVDRIAS